MRNWPQEQAAVREPIEPLSRTGRFASIGRARSLRQLSAHNRPTRAEAQTSFRCESQLWQLRRSCSFARAAGPIYDKSRPGRATAGQARNHRPTGIGPPGCQARLTHQALAPKRRRHYGPIRLGDADDRQPGKIGRWARNLLQGSELLDRPGRTGNSGALGRGPRYDRDRLSHLANLCR
jgi:hypothetical protein